MRKRWLSALAGIFVSTLAAAEEPTWYNRAENTRDVVTKQVGTIDDKTQGVVTVYGADWCGPCNMLEKAIEQTHLDENLAKEGIVFRYVRNQHEGNDKSKPRVNEHIKKETPWFRKELNGVPCVFVDDLGRSYECDKKELAAKQLRGGQYFFSSEEEKLPESDKMKLCLERGGLEAYIRRFALDQKVHLLTVEEAKKVLEALASDLYNVEFSRIYQDSRVGFRFTPKRNDEKTKESTRRLQMIDNAVLLNGSETYEPIPIESFHSPTQEQFERIKVSPGCEKYFQDELDFLKSQVNQ
jgi:hypothetical protein